VIAFLLWTMNCALGSDARISRRDCSLGLNDFQRHVLATPQRRVVRPERRLLARLITRPVLLASAGDAMNSHIRANVVIRHSFVLSRQNRSQIQINDREINAFRLCGAPVQ
jgi:hypothetical protein